MSTPATHFDLAPGNALWLATAASQLNSFVGTHMPVGREITAELQGALHTLVRDLRDQASALRCALAGGAVTFRAPRLCELAPAAPHAALATVLFGADAADSLAQGVLSTAVAALTDPESTSDTLLVLADQLTSVETAGPATHHVAFVLRDAAPAYA